MSFWNTSSGESAAQNVKTEHEVGGGYELIPDDSTVLAVIDEAKWDQDDSFNNYISLRWAVMEPEPVAKRKVWQKLWVKDMDPRAKTADAAAKKRDNALRMLATIDANAGGKLAKAGREPTDDDLAMALFNKPMAVKVRTWEMNGNTGNWVAGVFPKGKELVLGKAAPKKQDAPTGSGGSFRDDLDDDIPF